jgi:hypothetical protein
MRHAVAVVPLLFALAYATVAPAEGLATLSPVGSLRPEWSVERAGSGRAHVVGYVYNDNDVRNAANVWLRVEQLTAAGSVARVYQKRIAGDVLSRGRLSFNVPVEEGEGAATYRVMVESADWYVECR